MAASISSSDTGEGRARSNAAVLAAAFAINGSLAPITVTLGGLVGLYLLAADKSLATLPVTAMNVGVALGALPAAFLMRQVGRRSGLMSGCLAGISGSLTAVAAIWTHQFWLFVLATLLIGVGNAFSQQYRFAAADAGSAAFRARAISWVMVGGVVSAVIGPQTVIFAGDALAPLPFAGAFLGAAGLAAAGMAVLSLLGGEARNPPPVAASGGRPIGAIVAQPRFLVAALCGAGSFGLMSLVMTAAPLAMIGCGHSQGSAALGIQWHVIAMFAPSFFTGSLMNRFGKERVVAAGMALLTVSAGVALSGLEIAQFWIALVVLGIGWNFGFVGATAMLTDTYRPEEKGRAQGANDFIVFGAVALSSFSSGKLLDAVGWETINLIVFPVAILCLAALGWLALRSRPSPA